MNERLVAQVKRKLNITWNDEGTNARVQDIIQSAILDLKHKLGIADSDFDFSEAGAENVLFLAYCLYEFNHTLNEFDDNYSNLIAQTQAKYEVQHYQSEVSENE